MTTFDRLASALAVSVVSMSATVLSMPALATDPVPDSCSNMPLVWYPMNETSWNGQLGRVDNAGSLGNALDATAACDATLRPGCATETPRPPRGLPNTMLGAPAFFNAAGQRTSKPGCGPSGYFNWGKTTLSLVNGQMTVSNNWRQMLSVASPVGLNGIANQLTVAAWVNPYHRAPGGYYFTIVNRGSQFKLSLRRGYLTAEWIGSDGIKRTVSSTTLVDRYDGDPRWHHVAFTFANGTARLYIDGTEVPGYQDAAYRPYLDGAGNPIAPTFSGETLKVPAAGAPLEVGYTTTFMSGTANAPQGDAYRGLLDDVRIYGSALGAANIRAIATSTNCSCVGNGTQ